MSTNRVNILRLALSYIILDVGLLFAMLGSGNINFIVFITSLILFYLVNHRFIIDYYFNKNINLSAMEKVKINISLFVNFLLVFGVVIAVRL